MQQFIDNPKFWSDLDALLLSNEIVIDRPKGSRHPRYPEFVYAIDYGYIQGTSSMDGGGIDIFCGSCNSGLDAIMVIFDPSKKDSEIKLLYNCTEDEKDIVYAIMNRKMSGILLRRS